MKDVTEYFNVAISFGGCKTSRKIETIGRSLTEQEKQSIQSRLESY